MKSYDPLARYQQQPARYTCYRAAGPILVDGKLDEPSWQLAPKSSPFVEIVTGKPAWFDTRVALLWDDDCLYLGFGGGDRRVGHVTERDSRIYEENDVEVFIGGQDAYYEFEINALNTVYEVFWIWKDILKPGVALLWASGGRPRDAANDGPGWRGRPRSPAWRAVGLPGLGLSWPADGGTRGWRGQPARPHRPRVDCRTRVSLARTNSDRRWSPAPAEGWRCLAHRLFALREDRAGGRGAGSVRGMDVESPRSL